MSHYGTNLHYTTDRWSGFERLRVDVAQTSFFEGREFRTFKDLNVAAGATYVIKAVVPINIVLFGLDVALEAGAVRISTRTGGTEGGSFSETLPRFPANNMSLGKDHRKYNGVAYAPTVVITAGGTHNGGGTELDVIRLKANSNTNQASSVGTPSSPERGVGAGTYYFLINNPSADTVVGTFKARWEERP